MTQQSARSRAGGLLRIFSTSRQLYNPTDPIPSQLMAADPRLSQAATLAGSAKLAAVTSLVDKLTNDLETVNLLPHQRDAALEELKIYGRDPRNADPIFTKAGIEMLTRHAFNSPSSTTSRNALRCLCNALFLEKKCRQMYVDLGYEAKACSKLKNDNRDDEFLISRIIFLTTYDTNAKLADLIDKHQLADTVSKNLERHARHHNDSLPSIDPMQDMALAETLRLLFNITYHCHDKVSSFTQAVPHIVSLLCKTPPFTSDKPLDAPTGPLVNALSNLDLSAKEIHSALFPKTDSRLLTDRLIDILSRCRTRYDDEALETIAPSLLSVIRVLYEHAPDDVQASIREKLLPTEEDRNEVLGRTDSLSSWMLKASVNGLTPKLRDTISFLLFDLSDKDAGKFVENVGYGFASGFLYNNNMSIPQNASEAFSNGSGDSSRPVNPVTGQFLDAERHPDMPEMTEEEREREAERLFVLFERLRANGVISVENPVRTAVEEGRFEELPDDYQEERR
ncbi:guanine nucleotide exchange factor [Xylariaceae sp. FL1019]|nr:guanine nucleotide exchange factor [Xylariaceae sp. FL1019]